MKILLLLLLTSLCLSLNVNNYQYKLSLSNNNLLNTSTQNYISSTNKNETERLFVETFMINKAGLVIPSYCDQICLSNLRDKVLQLESRLK